MAKPEKLRKDTGEMGTAFRQLSATHNDLNKTYDRLSATHDAMLAGNTAELKKLLGKLDTAQVSLQKKEDEMRKTQGAMNNQQQKLNALEDSLEMREKNLAELKRVMAQRDSAATALKNAVSKALLGFENNGLTIQQKNGMVYVSLEEQLLFASGSTVVDKKGEEALKGLRKYWPKIRTST
jgi:chemotaxis protein MotB